MTTPWRDRALPAADRVADLLSRMTLEEKTAQLYGVWVRADSSSEDIAPDEEEMREAFDFDELITRGLGQLTRTFGTAPVDPALGARALARAQRRIMAAGRFGIPALAHEECLAGFTAWRATAYPVPLAWGATFDPALVEEMARHIGRDLASVGIHQGLSPVLDVVRDPRWGRVEETIGEDPYLVGTVGTAYVRGLESAGIVATLKHFAGYAASVGARNHAPVRAGVREFADVTLPPFEMALREGGARSVMAAYTETDGVPVSADPRLLTELLRDDWGFTGTVVSDYFGVGFLETNHRVAADRAQAAHAALAAGVDVELPTLRCYGEPLVKAVCAGAIPEALVDRAVRRVLSQKCELGLLDEDWTPEVAGSAGPGRIDLDSTANRALARRLAEESIVLLDNPDAVLPLAPDIRIAVVGPRADDPLAMLGCYSFPSHVLPAHPGTPLGIEIPTVLDSLRTELPDTKITYAAGSDVDGDDTAGFPEAVARASEADVCVAVLGDRAGLFGRGTSGEGCDAEDLRLPGVQAELLDALIATGTPVVALLLTGRPYALGRWHGRLAGVVQAFFPGEEGGPAVAGVLSGRVSPSGRLPVSVPQRPGGQPWTYLQPPLGLLGAASNLDPTPLYPFGYGRSYTTFAWTDFEAGGEEGGDVSVTVRNTGERAGAEVVQLYLHDPVASVTRPDVRLIAYQRLELAPGTASRVTFRFHPDVSSFTDRSGRRVVEPGALELRLGASSTDVRHRVQLTLTGPVREVGPDRRFHCGTEVRTVEG